jgi:hypothetical protein
MKRLTMLLLVLLAVAMCGPAWAVRIAPGLDVTIILNPSSGGPETTTQRTVTFTNTRLDTDPVEPLVIELGSWPSVLNGVPVEVKATFTVIGRPGTPGAYEVNLPMPLPRYVSFTPGELMINGVRQPDPTIVGGAYALTVTVPAATSATVPGKCVVGDRVDVLVTDIASVDAPLSLALRTSDDGRWQAGMKLVRTTVRYSIPQQWRWNESVKPPVTAGINVIALCSVPPGITYEPGSAHAYLKDQVGSADSVRGTYEDGVVTVRLGDMQAGYPAEVFWYAEPTGR